MGGTVRRMSNGFSRAGLDRLGALLRGQVESGHAPGALVVLAHHGEGAASRQGFLDLAADQKAAFLGFLGDL